MLKVHADVLYFRICIKKLTNSKVFFSIVYFIEHMIIMIHFSQSLQNIMSNSFDDIKQSSLLIISPLYYLRKLRQFNSDGETHSFTYDYLIAGIATVITFIGILAKYLIKAIKGPFRAFLVNLNEFLLLRLFNIFLLDIFINDAIISFYIMNLSRIVYSVYLCLFLFYYVYYWLDHVFTYHLFIYADIEYPFDALSIYFDTSLFIIKILLCAEETGQSLNWKRLVTVMILLVIMLFYIRVILLILYHPFYLHHNSYQNSYNFYLQTISYIFPILFFVNQPFVLVLIISTQLFIIIFIFISSDRLTSLRIVDSKNHFATVMDIISSKHSQDKMFLMELNLEMKKHYYECDLCSLCKIIRTCEGIEEYFPFKYIDIYSIFAKTNDYQKDLVDFKRELILYKESLIESEAKNNPNDDYSTANNESNKEINDNDNRLYILKIKLENLMIKYSRQSIHFKVNLHIVNDLLEFKIDDEDRKKESRQLILISDYIKDIHHSINALQKICSNEYFEIKQYYETIDQVNQLKLKKYDEISINRPNNSNKYQNIILSYIHENFLNIFIKDTDEVRDIMFSMEEHMMHHFTNDHQIIFSIDFSTMETMILQGGRDIVGYLHREIPAFFPEEFEMYQLKNLKQIVNKGMSRITFITHRDLQGTLFKRTTRGNIRLFDTITLEGKLLPCLSANTSQFIFTGNYTINSAQVIVTKTNSKKTIYGMTELLYDDLMKIVILPTADFTIDFANAVKTLNIQPEKLSINYIIDDNYHVYILPNINQSTIGNNPLKNIIANQGVINLGDSFIHNQFQDVSSMNSLSSTTYSSGLFAKYSTLKKKPKTFSDIISKYINVELFIFLLCFCIILFAIISFIFERKYYKDIITGDALFALFLTTSRVYYTTMTSFLSIVCIGHKESNDCVNYFNEYNKRFIATYPHISLNFTEFIHKENVIKLSLLFERQKRIQNEIYGMNDDEMSLVFMEVMDYKQVIANGDKVIIDHKKMKVNDMIKTIVNSLTVIYRSNAYIYHPVHLITYLPSLDLNNIYLPSELEDWQIEYYNLVINYMEFRATWFKLHNSINKYVMSHINQMTIITLSCLSTMFFLQFVFIILVLTSTHYFIIAQIKKLNVINNLMSTETFVVKFMKKMKMLSTLSYLYMKNPIKVITAYEGIDNDNPQALPTSPSPRKRRGNKLITSKEMKELDKEDNSKQKIASATHQRRFFSNSDLYFLLRSLSLSIIILFFYYLIHFTLFLIMTLFSMEKTRAIINYVQSRGYSEQIILSDFVIFQMIYYTNSSYSEFGTLIYPEEPLQFHYELMDAMNTFTSNGRDFNDIKAYSPQSEIKYDCASLYGTVEDAVFVEIKKNEPDYGFIEELEKICKVIGILDFNEEVIAFSIYFNAINTPMRLMTKRTYEQIEIELMKDDLHYASVISDFVMRPLRFGLSAMILAQTMANIAEMAIMVINFHMAISVVVNMFIFVFITYFSINSKRRKKRMKAFVKVFQI